MECRHTDRQTDTPLDVYFCVHFIFILDRIFRLFFLFLFWVDVRRFISVRVLIVFPSNALLSHLLVAPCPADTQDEKRKKEGGAEGGSRCLTGSLPPLGKFKTIPPSSINIERDGETYFKTVRPLSGHTCALPHSLSCVAAFPRFAMEVRRKKFPAGERKTNLDLVCLPSLLNPPSPGFGRNDSQWFESKCACPSTEKKTRQGN
mmetsp:Transcript_13963/g.27915  ORF Transcript_13963/g.27915 Transcript_13963/m.27915 type:complete len:204 (+) Transcript_13963:575-1186(+)